VRVFGLNHRIRPNHCLRDDALRLSSAGGCSRRRPTMLKRIALVLLLLGTVVTTAGISFTPTAVTSVSSQSLLIRR